MHFFLGLTRSFFLKVHFEVITLGLNLFLNQVTCGLFP